MPIKSLARSNLVDPLAEPLQQMIVDEMSATEHTEGGPTVFVDDAGGPHGYKHLFVVWDHPEWASLDRVRRSEIALDAYEEYLRVTSRHPEEEILKVTQSWGLTPAEADRFGVPADPAA